MSRTPLVRVGAVNYLNTKPLIYDLEQLVPNAELVLDLPSRLADQLAAGELEIALIPVIDYLRANCYSLVPGIAIASRGPVLSVTLFSTKPWPKKISPALMFSRRSAKTGSTARTITCGASNSCKTNQHYQEICHRGTEAQSFS